ncbi:MAG: hypothetical protein OQK73_13235, partial [Gammaproteobacteria bacterium]|nr:hypothetical protein [Gammaproteobacteria bacterium]
GLVLKDYPYYKIETLISLFLPPIRDFHLGGNVGSLNKLTRVNSLKLPLVMEAYRRMKLFS